MVQVPCDVPNQHAAARHNPRPVIQPSLEGPLALTPCVSQNKYGPCADCRSETECSLKLVMKRVREASAKIMDQVTFADLASQETALLSPFQNNFFEI